jgi:predicted RNA binding protein YcfA (HicA-like mRNA interferase family)
MGLSDLPLAKGRVHVKVLESFGWVVRRSKKNHFAMTNPKVQNFIVSIPDHKEVDRNLLRTELRKAGIAFCHRTRVLENGFVLPV